MSAIHLILGGARSGKSRLAEQTASAKNSESVTYIATAQALDDEMVERINQHQQQRPQTWQLIEAPLNLSGAIEQAFQQSPTVLVDCLTLWLSNCLCHDDVSMWPSQKKAFLQQLEAIQTDDDKNLILVSNEVGHGIVPMGELSRQFVDQAGWLHQDIAKIAKQVDFVIAGISMPLKAAVANAATDATKSETFK